MSKDDKSAEVRADSQLIWWLLHDSGVSRYRIAKEANISEATVSRIASETTPLAAIKFGSAQKLTAFAEAIQAEQAAGIDSHETEGDAEHGEKETNA